MCGPSSFPKCYGRIAHHRIAAIEERTQMTTTIHPLLRSLSTSALLLSNTLFLAPAQTAPASASCQSTVTGTLEILPLTSKIFGNTRYIRVWLPPRYSDPKNASRTYPALYVLDGEMLFDRCTAPGQSAEWRIDETLSELIRKQLVEPLIVVGIDSSGRTRSHEFAPYRMPFPPYDPIAPAGDQFPDFVTTEVMPLVKSRYRLSEERAQTGIGGSSLGAAAALYTILHRSDVFGLALLESTSLQVGNGQLLRDTSLVVVGPIRVSIGVGTEEPGPGIGKMLGVPNFDSGFVQLSKTLAANFAAAVFNHPEVKLTIESGAHHTAYYWGKRFPEAVQFLYPPQSH